MVPIHLKIVYIQRMRNKQEPSRTITVGTEVFPSPRLAAIVLSIKLATGYEKNIIEKRSIPA